MNESLKIGLELLVGIAIVESLWTRVGFDGHRKDKDETGTLLARLSSRVSELLQRSRVKVYRRPLAKHGRFAATHYIFLARMFISTEYNVLDLEPDLEDFVIAHELGHVRSKDPVVLSLFTSLLSSGAATAGLAAGSCFSVGAVGASVVIAVTVLVFLLLVLPARLALEEFMESQADKFAVRYVGTAVAVRSLKHLASLSDFKGSHGITRHLSRRIRRLEALTTKLSVGSASGGTF